MKTKEFIEMLQKEDPKGVAEVCVGGIPVYCVEHLPGYYDGPYSVLIEDPTKEPYYRVTGIKHTREGCKLCIKTMDTEDILCDDPEATVILDPSLGHERITDMQIWVEEKREEYRKIKAEVEAWSLAKKKENI